jgi:nicotinate-nucleotide pyrophosphorylase
LGAYCGGSNREHNFIVWFSSASLYSPKVRRYNEYMEKTELVDVLVARLEQLQEMMQVADDNVTIDNVLLQALVNHANETTLNAVIVDVERMILIKDDELGTY